MWKLKSFEYWENLCGGSGSKTRYVGTIDLPERPKAADIRKEVAEFFPGFKVTELDLSLRSAGFISGDLERTEPETRALDFHHVDGFQLDLM